MEQRESMEVGGFHFFHHFDSGNLGHVERVPTEQIVSSINTRTNNLETPDFEFNIWTRPDCYGTEYENGNRTWFYFGMRSIHTHALVRLNIINLNKQGKMYSQGMAPVTRTLPGQPHWERIKEKPVHWMDDNTFTLSFKYKTSDNAKAMTYFAFTYPYSFSELQTSLTIVDQKFLPLPPMQSLDDIYYCRENLIYTLEKRRTDLLTISSYHGITEDREERLKNLFPDKEERPFKFENKKFVFISARVHPGETPSSFVFNGFLNLLLNRNDPVAIALRKLYVFKLIPFLNPDGVARGHYRTDTRGVNLNRVYLNPSLEYHPTVYAARALIRYHHFGYEREEDLEDDKTLPYQTYSRTAPSISQDTFSTIEDTKSKKKPLVKNKITHKQQENKNLNTIHAYIDSINEHRTFASTETVVGDSITMISKKEDRLGENLSQQVSDMKLQELKSEPISNSESMFSTDTRIDSQDSSYLLDEVVVRDCFGSEIHISKSDELSHLQGPNPLRQLRNSLKNSICLLVNGIPFDNTYKNENPDDYYKSDQSQQKKDNSENKDYFDPSFDNTPESSKQLVGHEFETRTLVYSISNGDAKTQHDLNTKSSFSTGATSSVDAQTITTEDASEQVNGDDQLKSKFKPIRKKNPARPLWESRRQSKEPDSGLFLYVDLHGHASKKGIFMYGNHFDDTERCVDCMLLPRIMSLNNLHFHFSSCNFTERNMYLKDRRDGMSREGSGRVAVLKATGLVRSYTLECNYNTGRLVNILPPTLRDAPSPPNQITSPIPPKYTPHIFEEVGRSLGASILDLTNHHPNSRIPSSEHRSLATLKEWLRSHMRSMRPPQLTMSRLRPKTSSPKTISPTRAAFYPRPPPKKLDLERKENTYAGAKPEEVKKPTALRSAHPTNVAAFSALTKKGEKLGSRSRLFEPDKKPKNLTTKKRSVLAIRKPNAGKARAQSAGKIKTNKRTDESAPISAVSSRISKNASTYTTRSFKKDSRSDSRCKVVASSSSSEVTSGAWDESPGPAAIKRRPHPPPLNLTAPRLKKIRLKNTS